VKYRIEPRPAPSTWNGFAPSDRETDSASDQDGFGSNQLSGSAGVCVEPRGTNHASTRRRTTERRGFIAELAVGERSRVECRQRERRQGAKRTRKRNRGGARELSTLHAPEQRVSYSTRGLCCAQTSFCDVQVAAGVPAWWIEVRTTPERQAGTPAATLRTGIGSALAVYSLADDIEFPRRAIYAGDGRDGPGVESECVRYDDRP
jgi:hypothetical protein